MEVFKERVTKGRPERGRGGGDEESVPNRNFASHLHRSYIYRVVISNKSSISVGEYLITNRQIHRQIEPVHEKTLKLPRQF